MQLCVEEINQGHGQTAGLDRDDDTELELLPTNSSIRTKNGFFIGAVGQLCTEVLMNKN
jgi:hypothetical protein